MSVYVDNARIPYGRMLMCHMFADTREELQSMADRIGVARRWLQSVGLYKEHYDICLSKRALALRHGALPIDSKLVAALLRARRVQ